VVLQVKSCRTDQRTIVLSSIAFLAVLIAWDKPSPFAVKKEEPVVAPVAPVSPVRVVRPVKPAASVPATVALPVVIRPENRSTPPSVAVTPEAAAAPAEPQRPASAQIVVDVEDKAPPVKEMKTGMAKDDVVAALGKASTHISMFEDKEFVESLRYEWKGRWVGTVRLSNGKVTKIDTPR
jgi:hypothetical protein